MTPPTGPTPYQVEAALAYAKPGRLLPLDNDGNMSAPGVQEVIYAINVLASALNAEREEVERLKAERRKKNGWKEPLGLVHMPCEICGEVQNHIEDAHRYFHSGIRFWADKYDSIRAKRDDLLEEVERLKAEQGYDRHGALEAALAAEKDARIRADEWAGECQSRYQSAELELDAERKARMEAENERNNLVLEISKANDYIGRAKKAEATGK